METITQSLSSPTPTLIPIVSPIESQILPQNTLPTDPYPQTAIKHTRDLLVKQEELTVDKYLMIENFNEKY